VFEITESAKEELQKRIRSDQSRQWIRLQMRHSCFMKLKLTLERVKQADDTVVIIDGLHFIIAKDHLHYFNHKKIDFIPDKLGFKQFEALEPDHFST